LGILFILKGKTSLKKIQKVKIRFISSRDSFKKSKKLKRQYFMGLGKNQSRILLKTKKVIKTDGLGVDRGFFL
jgi:hypothetical protein